MRSHLVSRQVAAVALFVSMVFSLSEKLILIQHIIWTAQALFLAGFVNYRPNEPWMPQARTFILIILITVGLSPILKTLTRDISDDSIWALSSILFSVHLLFHDYRQESRPNFVSLNAALFASVMLASRFEDNFAVTSIVIIGIESFVLTSATLKHRPTGSVSWLLALLYILAAVHFISLVSYSLMLIFVFLLLFITFLFPLWFTASMKFKNEISGPWDEARINHKDR